MKKLLILAVICLLATPVFAKSKVTYQAEPQQIIFKTQWSETELLSLAEKISIEKSVSFKQMATIIERECPWKFRGKDKYYDSMDAQSRLTYNADQIRRHPDWGEVGEREKSFGCTQIHAPAHPDISQAQAVSPEWSFNYLADNLAKGNGRIWTTYQK